MKRYLTILLVAITVATSFAQSGNAHVYRAFSEFTGDTVQYLKANFASQSEYFHGKTLGELLTVYEKDLNIGAFTWSSTSPCIHPQGRTFTTGVSIMPCKYEDYIHSLKHRLPFISLKISILPPHPDTYLFWSKMPDYETDREEAWYAKDLLIDKIEIHRFLQGMQ